MAEMGHSVLASCFQNGNPSRLELKPGLWNQQITRGTMIDGFLFRFGIVLKVG
jgi:hypothetical protein